MKTYTISNGQLIDIAIGDRVDIIPGLLTPDEKTGLSFEVCKLLDSEVLILVKLDGIAFSEVTLSTTYIMGNYRKVQ